MRCDWSAPLDWAHPPTQPTSVSPALFFTAARCHCYFEKELPLGLKGLMVGQQKCTICNNM